MNKEYEDDFEDAECLAKRKHNQPEKRIMERYVVSTMSATLHGDKMLMLE